MAGKDDDDDLYDTVSGMADRLDLAGKERRTYIHEHMTRGGYRMEPSYVKGDPDDDEDDTGGGFFGSRNRSRNDNRNRNTNRNRSRGGRQRDDDDGW